MNPFDLLTFNIVKQTENILISKGYNIPVVSAFPDYDTLALPFVVVSLERINLTPYEIGSLLEWNNSIFIWTVFGTNDSNRNELLYQIHFNLRSSDIIIYDVKVTDKIVTLDTDKPLLTASLIPQSIYPIPALSEHPYDRYRGELVATINFVGG